MKVVFDIPDDPNRDAIPYPIITHEAVGYLFMTITPVDGKLQLNYRVGRDSVAVLDEANAEKLYLVFEELERLASRAKDHFRILDIEEIPA